jgi:2-polyprenyl-3-methyl-5-hydroxy-6-metoxy-1,4-benzoquinol methylase
MVIPNLNKEAKDFDFINKERGKNMKSILLNDDRIENYFYKNPWRYKFSRDYAFNYVINEFQSVQKWEKKLNILDIGCGNGWFSLNANLTNKDSWDCIDISKEAINIANVYKNKLCIDKNTYFINSIENFKSKKKYDIITCVNSLHHINNLELFILKIKKYLKKEGRVFIYDVSSDKFSKVNASFILLIRIILESTKNIYYFEKFKDLDIDIKLKKIVYEWQNETEGGKQSIHDHFNSTHKIISYLTNSFEQVYFKKGGGILTRLLGGLRGNIISIEKLANQLIYFEELLIKEKIIQPYFYTYIGKNKEEKHA